MKLIILIVSVLMSACAADNKDSAPVQAPAGDFPVSTLPVPTVPVVKSVVCGDTIISTMNMAFRIDLVTAETFVLKDGVYGYPEKRINAWYVEKACSYEILNGEVVK